MSDELVPRLLAIDYGQKRIGLAVSDPMGNFAVGLETLVVHYQTDICSEIKTICDAYQVVQIIIGLPKRLNGEEGIQADKVREFAETLSSSLDLPVVFFDERLTSKLAHQTLQQQGYKPSRHREWVDQASAKRILQDYMERQENRAKWPKEDDL
ncbi:MAG: Holliday junction resolvase RuvX [Cyanobacteria bacterium]|nr:Holliday junction resolvase RuvX [Cyanobacteriota bacterium]